MARFKLQPELEKLEIDTGWATPEAIPFILAAKRLRNLQIHRTTLGDADLAVLAAGLPELETLLLRPNGRKDAGRITYASLKHLRALPKLRHLILGLTWGELTFVGGLDGLVGVAGLRQLDLNPGDSKGFSLDDPAVQALHQARPDILIRGGGKTLGGAPDQVREDEDAAWNWDKGVNTHG
jgi:hypothetical protein